MFLAGLQSAGSKRVRPKKMVAERVEPWTFHPFGNEFPKPLQTRRLLPTELPGL